MSNPNAFVDVPILPPGEIFKQLSDAAIQATRKAPCQDSHDSASFDFPIKAGGTHDKVSAVMTARSFQSQLNASE
ncbi:hypothetical protein [Capybara microvirus Cap3_SP_333]|nr:hypothetical protein [Capybara microvirus Cap3_SP_333]